MSLPYPSPNCGASLRTARPRLASPVDPVAVHPPSSVSHFSTYPAAPTRSPSVCSAWPRPRAATDRFTDWAPPWFCTYEQEHDRLPAQTIDHGRTTGSSCGIPRASRPGITRSSIAVLSLSRPRRRASLARVWVAAARRTQLGSAHLLVSELDHHLLDLADQLLIGEMTEVERPPIGTRDLLPSGPVEAEEFRPALLSVYNLICRSAYTLICRSPVRADV